LEEPIVRGENSTSRMNKTLTNVCNFRTRRKLSIFEA